MDKNYVKTAIEGLKSTSSSRVQETLLKIRYKITTNDEGIRLFRECNGLEMMLPLLRKPNEKILDVSLSILGNCCLEEEFALTVGKLNILASLTNILKTVCRDSILGRTCRVIGNLAQRNCNAEGLHNHGVVTLLVELIEDRDKDTSYPTLTMAVRAIRQLWMVVDKRDEMLSLNAVRCVAVLMATECELAGVVKSGTTAKDSEGFKKSQEELITGILKCVGYFTTHSTLQCAEQIQGDGRGYQCLVALTKYNESLSLKCLMNLCYVSQCRPLLGTAGLVECLVGLLQKVTEVDQWPEGAARALSHLSGESVNRQRLRHSGGLTLLVAAARNNTHAMHALLQYVFDDTAFQILVNEGLIGLLTDELTLYLKSMQFEHNHKVEISQNVNTQSNESAAVESNEEPAGEGSINSTSSDSKPSTSSSDFINDIPLVNMEEHTSLFKRRRQSQLLSKNEDELKVVIERDNMIVGFVDTVDSDASDDSHSDDDRLARRKGLKRVRSKSIKSPKKKPQIIKMANKDWSAGVYWEPKSPEWPSLAYSSVSPDRGNLSPKSPYSDGNQSGFSPEYKGFSSQSKRARFDWSPESGLSTGEGSSTSPYWTEYQWSPSSSGSPTSPYSAMDESSGSDISGRYSPVCSEAEGEAEPAVASIVDANKHAAAELDAAQVAHDLDELIMDDDESVDEVHSEEDATKINMNSKSSRIACVLVLLFRVSHGACSSQIREEQVSNHTLELLTGSECLNALLDYVERCKRPLGRAARILARVLSNALCLMSILRHRLVLRLHRMSVMSKHLTTECPQCKQIVRLSTKLLAQLTILAESSYGIGEISYQLLKGSASMKQTLALTLPYIVRTQKPLKKYFIDCGALNILFSLITESQETLQDCVTALSKLAMSIQVRDPKSVENNFNEHISVTYDPILDNLKLDDIVTFQLDDLSTVQANRVFLCQNSEVFSAMLMGYFKESIENHVRLKNVSKPALEYLLTLLHCGLNDSLLGVQTFPLAEQLETNLEVLLLADRFLFKKLKFKLRSAILQFLLTPKTADKIYVWSLNDGMELLCVESVAYLLSGKMCEEERADCFKSITALEYKEQWLDDIKTVLLQHMGVH